MALSGLQKMLTFSNFQQYGVRCWWKCLPTLGVWFWCDGTLCNGRCYDHCNYRQMLCLPMWKMWLPQLLLWCGRQWVTEADVTVSLLSNGRCYSHVADGIATLGWIYFSISSEMLNRTSSHMWGRWYLPMFLLRDGLLTLIYFASLIVLIRFWFSIPTSLKLSMVVLWPVMLKFSKCSGWLSYIFIITFHPVTFISVDDTTLLWDAIFILGSHKEASDSIHSFKVHLYSMISAYILQALT